MDNTQNDPEKFSRSSAIRAAPSDTECRVYEFQTASDFLKHVLLEKKHKNPLFSVRAWSKHLGFTSASMLASVLREDRRLKPALAIKIGRTLGLSEEERKYFEILALLENAQTLEEKAIYEDVLNFLRPRHEYLNVELEKFKLISDWYHSVILEMINLKGFLGELNFITSRIIGGLPAVTLQKAVVRLRALGLLKVRRDGKWVRTPKEPYSGEDVPNEAIRNHHSQMLDRAKLAIAEQSVTERVFWGSSIAIRLSDFNKVEKLIQQFHRQVHKLESKGDADEVYRLNTQFFKLTRK
jgi:uncharacterized protein (TIGR02147 family)